MTYRRSSLESSGPGRALPLHGITLDESDSMVGVEDHGTTAFNPTSLKYVSGHRQRFAEPSCRSGLLNSQSAESLGLVDSGSEESNWFLLPEQPGITRQLGERASRAAWDPSSMLRRIRIDLSSHSPPAAPGIRHPAWSERVSAANRRVQARRVLAKADSTCSIREARTCAGSSIVLGGCWAGHGCRRLEGEQHSPCRPCVCML